jgi:hypothetical protein
MPKLTWLGGSPSSNTGTTFAVPWGQGQCFSDCSSLACFDPNGQRLPLQSWNTAYWPDGSIKWTGHALPGISKYPPSLSVDPTSSSSAPMEDSASYDETVSPIKIDSASDNLEVDTGKIKVTFSTTGDSIIKEIVHSTTGKAVARNGHLIYRCQSSVATDDEVPDNRITQHSFKGKIDKTEIERDGPVRVVVRIEGKHQQLASSEQTPFSTFASLPFILRFYLYANSDSIRAVHTVIYDQNPQEHFIRGIGIRFHVPLNDEPPYNRHVRLAGEHGGIFHEAVQNVTGLWKDPGQDVRVAQTSGQPTPPLEQWNADFRSGLRWVPKWSDFTLQQLSSDGYTMKKRTKTGHSWVNIPGGTKASGLVYLGGPKSGGLGIGMRSFWERYPTQLDIRNADTDLGETTLWLYSPAAEPMDMRPYHDGLGEETYDDQLDAMRITYEDWEPGMGTPYGIARTNELYLYAFDSTPSTTALSTIVNEMRNPPLLIADSEYIHGTKAFGDYWTPFSTSQVTIKHNPKANDVLENLEFLFNFYQKQITQRRWYGFWDHGDIMHTYDGDRHTWRYDIGGYAWDNSELSPDLWLWLYFLCTRRQDVYQIAESLTRHTSEVDMYHLGQYKGLGTRHGVQHWSDSCKQARISNVLYRKFFYYLTGGDERIGEIVRETLEAEKTYLFLDPYRKVRKDRGNVTSDPERGILISLGTDWCALAASWMMEWERKGPQWELYRDKLFNSVKGIVHLKNGFVTGQAHLNIQNGNISPPPSDPHNAGHVQVAHLSAMFGLVETCAELLDLTLRDPSEQTILEEFRSKWHDYCIYYNAENGAQINRYGVSFPKLILRQGHSRLTAYVARELGEKELARRAWKEFYERDGYAPSLPWTSVHITGSAVPVAIDEASWVSSNITALYGLAAIQNLAFVEQYLDI